MVNASFAGQTPRSETKSETLIWNVTILPSWRTKVPTILTMSLRYAQTVIGEHTMPWIEQKSALE
jgi:hypothetical protein